MLFAADLAPVEETLVLTADEAFDKFRELDFRGARFLGPAVRDLAVVLTESLATSVASGPCSSALPSASIAPCSILQTF